MSATQDVHGRFQQLQKPDQARLSAVVVEECSRLKLSYTNGAPIVQPTRNETERIAHHLENDFNGLHFTVGVNLVDSKKAFKLFLSGLDDSQDFTGLLALPAHNPHTYPNPIGQIDMSFATKTKQEAKDPQSTKDSVS